MIRLTLLLVAGLIIGMKMAERLPEPPEHFATTQKIQVAALEDNLRGATPVDVPSERPRRRPDRVPIASAPSVPFNSPTLVDANGKPIMALPEQVAAPAPASSADSVADDAGPEAALIVRYVAANRVNVREGPSTDNPVTGSVAYADAVEILSEPVTGWVEIRIEGDGVYGFMAARFLQETPPG